VAQGGRCRRCRARISKLPLTVELLNTVLWALLAARFGLTTNGFVLMPFVTVLLVLIVIDFRHYLLPDAITLPGIAAGVLATWLPGWPVSRLDAALSAAIGYFVMMIIAKVAELYYGEEALGQGDWKLVAMLGAFLGSTKVMITLLAANGAGAVFGLLLVATSPEHRGRKLPLGSFLGASGIVIAFW
jgi:leader peptidase (prepilin peptidase)/N-methyltransferase